MAVPRIGGEDKAWVRRPWCVWTAVGLVALGAILNTIYLFNHCPLDLSGDEAHYWEWSRHLDYGYYSKPPGIAWVIAATLRIGNALGINGDGSGAALMPVMRMAAVFFGLLSGLLSLLLARRIFRDDRAALAVIVLSAAVPMFAVGSLLITIDSPMYLCWAATVYCLWRAVEETANRAKPCAKWMIAAGFCAALGMLFKPVLLVLPACTLIAAIGDRRGGVLRKTFFSLPAVLALALMLCSQIPVLIWNSHHNWVMFKHISTQGFGTGAAKSALQEFLLDPIARLASFVGGQAGGMGGVLFVLLVVAVVTAWRRVQKARRSTQPANTGIATPTGWTFLLCVTVPWWAFCFLMNFWKGTELNWPAATYFTGMILLAGVFVEGWNALDLKNRKAWRTWGSIAIAVGIVMTAAAMNMQRLYGLAAEKLQPLAGTAAYGKSWWNPRKWDPAAGKLRGFDARAQAIEKVRQEIRTQTGKDPLIIAGRYDDASSLSFYLPGHPFVFCIMSSVGGRQNQYDLWPGLSEASTTPGSASKYAGLPAIIVGDYDEKSLARVLHFDDLGKPETLDISVGGVVIRQITIRRAIGFIGQDKTKSAAF